MSVPAPILTAIADLQTAFQDASPLAEAPPLVYANVRDQARDLVAALDAAIDAADAGIDGFATPDLAPAIPAALLALAGQCADQGALCDLRGLIGRARTNINLAQV